jgi:hypothetical protein
LQQKPNPWHRVESSPPVLAHRRFARLDLSVEEGFDGLGVIVVPCVTDGTSVTLVETPPAPEPETRCTTTRW